MIRYLETTCRHQQATHIANPKRLCPCRSRESPACPGMARPYQTMFSSRVAVPPFLGNISTFVPCREPDCDTAGYNGGRLSSTGVEDNSEAQQLAMGCWRQRPWMDGRSEVRGQRKKLKVKADPGISGQGCSTLNATVFSLPDCFAGLKGCQTTANREGGFRGRRQDHGKTRLQV